MFKTRKEMVRFCSAISGLKPCISEIFLKFDFCHLEYKICFTETKVLLLKHMVSTNDCNP